MYRINMLSVHVTGVPTDVTSFAPTCISSNLNFFFFFLGLGLHSPGVLTVRKGCLVFFSTLLSVSV